MFIHVREVGIVVTMRISNINSTTSGSNNTGRNLGFQARIKINQQFKQTKYTKPFISCLTKWAENIGERSDIIAISDIQLKSKSKSYRRLSLSFFGDKELEKKYFLILPKDAKCSKEAVRNFLFSSLNDFDNLLRKEDLNNTDYYSCKSVSS